MHRLKYLILLIILFQFVTSCDGLKMPRNIFETSERTKYERSFSGSDSLMTRWKTVYSSAQNSQLKIKDGSVLQVYPSNENLHALGYSLELKRGDQLIIETGLKSTETKVFIDINHHNSELESYKSELVKNNQFSKVIEQDGWHKVIIQSEIDFRESFELKIYTQPSLGFPVAGKGNRDVQSFWGASRDGGGRSHEGVDIFAKRGTPLIAVTNGYVTRTGNQGLGGKQVWLRDEVFGNSYYYAHLDSIMTQNGKQVKMGDTLGTVGNTGNAAGGATHLHFGVYTSGGAVNPYPYIRKREILSSIKLSKLSSSKFIKAGSNLRNGPGTQYEVVTSLNTKQTALILSSFGSWNHVKTVEGLEGFILNERME